MPNMAGYRRAAVALHALSEEDRHWMLAELPAADKATLAQYLEELKGLGFTTEAAVQHDSLFGKVAKAVPNQPSDFVRDATALEMLSVLEGEPSSLIAQLMAIRNWRWREGFLRLCSPIRQDRIRAAISATTCVAPARKAFLLEAIGNRLKENRAMNQLLPPIGRGWKLSSHDVMYRVLSLCRRLVKPWSR
jgi:hypothetical protein